MKAYLTGSRAYGTPRDDSDIDLVIACDAKTLGTLWEFNEGGKGLRYGKLNLVAFNLDDAEEVARYDRWKIAHDKLAAAAPVTKEVAIEMFRSHDAEKVYVDGHD